jgi:lipooligosaccharide transport system permease protein
MNSSKTSSYPPLYWRLYSVWFRHMKVYTTHLFSNGFPPFIEPLVFLVGIGFGLGTYIKEMDGMPYREFLGTGLLVTTAMFTAGFECSFGTFIRLEYHKVYDGMLASPLTANDLIIGEILWAGTKGFFFSAAVLIVLTLFGVVSMPFSLASPFIGFITALMFASLSLLVTSFVKTINHFNFYFTGFISPMFFFSGVVFPIKNLPPAIQPITELVPLTHSVRLVRAICTNHYKMILLWDILYITLFVAIIGYFATKRLTKRLVK